MNKVIGGVIEELKQTTAAQLFRHATTIGMVITPLWLFSGPFVKAYAADALLEVLKQQGIDPAVIKEMKQQGVDNGSKIKNLDEDADKIRGDISAVRQQVGKVSDQIEQQSKSVDKVEDLLRQLILQRRAESQP